MELEDWTLVEDRELLARMIGKYLFGCHHHEEAEGERIIYVEADVITLLKKLGHPEPDWDWYKYE